MKHNPEYSYANRRLMSYELMEEWLKKQNAEQPDSQEEETTCPHCGSEDLEYRSRLVACATMAEPEEREGWVFCMGCGEETDYDDV